MSMVLRENNNSSRIYRLVFDFVEKEKLLKGVSNLLVAVSGGPDSLALLKLFVLHQLFFIFPFLH